MKYAPFIDVCWESEIATSANNTVKTQNRQILYKKHSATKDKIKKAGYGYENKRVENAFFLMIKGPGAKSQFVLTLNALAAFVYLCFARGLRRENL